MNKISGQQKVDRILWRSEPVGKEVPKGRLLQPDMKKAPSGAVMVQKSTSYPTYSPPTLF